MRFVKYILKTDPGFILKVNIITAAQKLIQAIERVECRVIVQRYSNYLDSAVAASRHDTLDECLPIGYRCDYFGRYRQFTEVVWV